MTIATVVLFTLALVLRPPVTTHAWQGRSRASRRVGDDNYEKYRAKRPSQSRTLRWREEDQQHQFFFDIEEPVFSVGLDQDNAALAYRSLCAADTNFPSAANNIVKLVFCVR